MTPQSFIFIGRPGAGKGTQAELLIETIKTTDSSQKILYIETGEELRKYFTNNDTYTARLTKETLEQGLLMPEFMPIYIWVKIIVERFEENMHLIFDGTPRRLIEAEGLDSIFPFFKLHLPKVIYLNIGHEESMKRIAHRKQGRKDDSKEVQETRRKEFEANVLPVIDFYREHKGVKFIEINGERPIQEVHRDIMQSLDMKMDEVV